VLETEHDVPPSNFAFNLNLRRYSVASEAEEDNEDELEKLFAGGRGLHSSTFQLNASAFCGIGAAFRRCLGVFREV